MKKYIVAALFLLAVLLLLASCNAGHLPDGMDETDAESKAKEIVVAMADGDYEQVVTLYGADALAAQGVTPPTAEEWAASGAAMQEELQLGAFQEFTSTRYQTTQDETFGECGVVLLGCQYENMSIAWRVVFSPEMDIIGMWM